jgi:hypothetical protein
MREKVQMSLFLLLLGGLLGGSGGLALGAGWGFIDASNGKLTVPW